MLYIVDSIGSLLTRLIMKRVRTYTKKRGASLSLVPRVKAFALPC